MNGLNFISSQLLLIGTYISNHFRATYSNWFHEGDVIGMTWSQIQMRRKAMWQLCAHVGCVRPTHNLATTNSITFKPSLTSFTPRSISQPPLVTLVKLNPKVSGSTAYKMKTIAVCAILCMLCLGGKITYESLLWSYCNRKDLILRAWSIPIILGRALVPGTTVDTC